MFALAHTVGDCSAVTLHESGCTSRGLQRFLVSYVKACADGGDTVSLVLACKYDS